MNLNLRLPRPAQQNTKKLVEKVQPEFALTTDCKTKEYIISGRNKETCKGRFFS